MAQANTNSIAAVLSLLVRVLFWLAIIAGVGIFILVGTGFFGSLNGGDVKMPGVEASVEGVVPGQLLISMVGVVVFFAGFAFVCNQLSRILSTLAEGDPFVPENGPRLTRIAIAVAAIEIIRTATVLIGSTLVDLGDNMRPSINVNLAAWGAVVVLFVLAQVFREGTRLREEEKMTI